MSTRALRSRSSRCVAVHGTAPKSASSRLITAIKTPYKSNGKFDIDAYDRHVSSQIENGVEGVVVGGTTGMARVAVGCWLACVRHVPLGLSCSALPCC